MSPPAVTRQCRGASTARGSSAAASAIVAIAAIRRAYRLLYMSGLPLADALTAIREQAEGHPELVPLAEFVANSTRSIVR